MYQATLFHREGGTKALHGETPEAVRERVVQICKKFKGAYVASTIIHEVERCPEGRPRVWPAAWDSSFSDLSANE